MLAAVSVSENQNWEGGEGGGLFNISRVSRGSGDVKGYQPANNARYRACAETMHVWSRIIASIQSTRYVQVRDQFVRTGCASSPVDSFKLWTASASTRRALNCKRYCGSLIEVSGGANLRKSTP